MISARGEGEPIEGSDSLSRRVEVTYLSYTTTTTISTDFIVHATKMKKVVDTPAEPAPKSAAISSPTPNATSAGPTPYAPQPDTIITLANINFIEDSPNLTEASRMIIPEYVRMLQRYKADSLEIDGYCHSLTPITNTSDPLFKLSVQRAKLIFDYLVDEGFDRTRLSYKGMGNATPKNEHPVTADEARANMRVEIRVFQRKHR
jgi:outer membrane protein OmpA-like peptidoglycan-associated protein